MEAQVMVIDVHCMLMNILKCPEINAVLDSKVSFYDSKGKNCCNMSVCGVSAPTGRKAEVN